MQTETACDNLCLPTQSRDPLKDTGLLAKILTRRVAVQTVLRIRHSYIL